MPRESLLAEELFVTAAFAVGDLALANEALAIRLARNPYATPKLVIEVWCLSVAAIVVGAERGGVVVIER